MNRRSFIKASLAVPFLPLLGKSKPEPMTLNGVPIEAAPLWEPSRGPDTLTWEVSWGMLGQKLYCRKVEG